MTISALPTPSTIARRPVRIEAERVPHAAFVRIPEACGYSGISRSRLYELATAGRVRFVKLGRRTLVEMASLHAFLAAL